MSAIYFCRAQMMIDYEHPGFTNQFLVSVHHPMAILYNDLSPRTAPGETLELHCPPG